MVRASIFVSICAVVLVGCGDDVIGTAVPPDANTSDGAGAEPGNVGDSGAVDAVSSQDALANDAAATMDAFANDAAATMDAFANVDASADANVVDAIAPAEASQVDAADSADAPDANDVGACGDAGVCCGAAGISMLEDSNNCGRCGHRCGGGACTSGVCQPFLVATLPETLAGAYSLAANDSYVFVSGNNSDGTDPVIDSVPLDGGAVQVFAPAADPAYELFVDPSTLYWVSGQSISSDSVDGDGGVTTIVARDTSAIVGFGLDPAGTFLYWGELSSTNNLTVWMDSADGGTPTAIWDGGNQQCGGVEIAANEHDVYWSYQSNSSGFTVPVLTAGLGSTGVTATASVQATDQLAVQGNSLFVLSSSSNGPLVEALPLDGGPPTFYGDEAGTLNFAVDPNWLYLADFADTLLAFPLDGGGSVVLDDNVDLETKIATTTGFIYWVTSGTPLTVMGVATP